MRNSYHTAIKLSYRMNLLPVSITRQIPRSILHRFKNTDYSNIFGIELAVSLERNELLIKELLQCRSALVVSKCIIQIKNTLIKIKDSAMSSFQKMKEIISVINEVKESIGFDIALHHFNISRSTFHSWAFQVRHFCYDSFIGKGVRRWPNQVPLSSVEKIMSLCEDEMFKGWSLVSIAHYAKRSGLLDISLHSWYKYARLIGISAKPPQCFKKRKTGIRAVHPHRFWHCDISVFKTMDNIKAYIYLVVDNFSRAILSWRVSLKLSAETRLETIKEAYEKFIHDFSSDVQLIVDEYISSPGISIKKIIAQQDIIFSNSMVEALNKIVKYRSLFLHNIPDIHALQRHLEKFVPVYNDIRPHCSLKGLTPSEVLAGMRPDNRDDLKKSGLIGNNRCFERAHVIKCSECL